MGDYTRLSAFDRFLLEIEDDDVHMHVAATCIFDAAPLRRPSGGIDVERIRRHVGSRLNAIPRYRQRLGYIPVENHPVWMDDYRFNLRYHVRHVSVPRPGDARQLKRLVGWINSQRLDRSKPLWEMWVIEGLEGDRFAILQKVHHSMIDGLAGAEEMAVLLSADPDDAIQLPRRWQPRPEPTSYELLRDALYRRAALPFVLGGQAVSRLAQEPSHVLGELGGAVSGLASLLGGGLQPASDTPFNRPIGSNRRADWLVIDLDRIKAVKDRLGGTINDVVLATFAGGMRRFFLQHGMSYAELSDLTVRAMCPVNMRKTDAYSTSGNCVSAMLVGLPVGCGDPAERYAAVCAGSRQSKDANHAAGSAALENLSDWTLPSLLTSVEQLAARQRTYNVVITNIPGPPCSLYLLGSQMLDAYPFVPLFPNQGIGVALLSYDGRLFWGFNADRDIVPDLHELVVNVEASFADLERAIEQLESDPGMRLRLPLEGAAQAQATR